MHLALEICRAFFWLGVGAAAWAWALQTIRRLPRGERRGAGWQKPVSPPPEGSRPGGLPPVRRRPAVTLPGDPDEPY